MDHDAERLPADPDLAPLELPEVVPGIGPVPRRQGAGARARWTLLAIALGGAGGALARYSIGVALPTTSRGFPWATFTVNVSGSAALAFLLVVVVRRLALGNPVRPLLGTGFIGAYTTFSTFALEDVQLFRHAAPAEAVLYAVVSLVGGLAAGFVGLVLARLLVPHPGAVGAGDSTTRSAP